MLVNLSHFKFKASSNEMSDEDFEITFSGILKELTSNDEDLFYIMLNIIERYRPFIYKKLIEIAYGRFLLIAQIKNFLSEAEKLN